MVLFLLLFGFLWLFGILGRLRFVLRGLGDLIFGTNITTTNDAFAQVLRIGRLSASYLQADSRGQAHTRGCRPLASHGKPVFPSAHRVDLDEDH